MSSAPPPGEPRTAPAPARPTLYIDLGSPYAYLAVERAPAILGALELEPILLGAIFQRRGRGSWAVTDRRAARMAEIEERVRRYGLPPLSWPEGWPSNSLAADRAATWAKRYGAVDTFVRTVYRRQFGEGADIAELSVLGACAADAGLDADELLDAIRSQATKDALRQATDRAWERGVRGVPTLAVGDALFYGDDRVEEAAEHLVASSSAPAD